jgi:murein DD-endopeptidase MepM/ murein hydrolase activator NlpD
MPGRIIAMVVALLVLGPPAFAQTTSDLTQSDVEAALAQRRDTGAALEELTGRYQRSMFDEELARERITNLAQSVSDLEREIGAKNVRVTQLVLTRYMAGSPLGTERVFSTSSFVDVPVQAEYYKLMNERDLALLTSLETSEKLHVEQQRLLDQSLQEQRALVADLEQMSAELLVALSAADRNYSEVAAAFQSQEEERRAAEEAERLKVAAAAAAKAAATQTARTATTTIAATTPTTTSTTASVTATTQRVVTTTQPVTTTTAPATSRQTTTSSSSAEAATTTTQAMTTTTQATTTTLPTSTTTTTAPPAATSGKTCPVNAATSFSNTWGAPRSGGRTHKGVDITAVRNAPVVAIESGTVTRTSNSTLGGLSIYLSGNSGSRYYYAHLDYIEGGIAGGTSVSVGQLLGGNGTTGNAPSWIPHVHFQYAPPGYGWVNPYSLVKGLCG